MGRVASLDTKNGPKAACMQLGTFRIAMPLSSIHIRMPARRASLGMSVKSNHPKSTKKEACNHAKYLERGAWSDIRGAPKSNLLIGWNEPNAMKHLRRGQYAISRTIGTHATCG